MPVTLLAAEYWVITCWHCCLLQIIDATRAKIAPLAAADNALWNDGDASRGYQQLITEWIPIRTKQLLQVCCKASAHGQLLSSDWHSIQIIPSYVSMLMSSSVLRRVVRLVLHGDEQQVGMTAGMPRVMGCYVAGLRRPCTAPADCAPMCRAACSTMPQVA